MSHILDKESKIKNFKELEKTDLLTPRDLLSDAIILILFGVVIIAVSLFLYFHFPLTNDPNDANIIIAKMGLTILITLGITTVIAGITIPFYDKIKRLDLYILGLSIFLYYLSYFLLFLLPR
jgi:heme/copper-type cytochrome/quinol oxidase subunit 2